MIVVSPQAGLCNRMRVMDACISVYKKNPNHNEIKLQWEKDELLNCGLDDLFERNAIFRLTENNLLVRYYRNYADRNNLPIKSLVAKFIYKLASRDSVYFGEESIKSKLYDQLFWDNIPQNLVIDTCQGFYSEKLQNPEYFVPIKSIQDKIDQIVQQYPAKTAGVHIRRTDNVQSRTNSSTDAFISKMNSLLSANPDYHFFLATDDANEERILIDHFKDRIIIQPGKDLSRNSTKGIQDALVDLYCLANCNLILGSYWSSFSITAAGLKNIPLEIIEQ